jgi:nifR3 family TIM-barrel protein
MAGITDIAFRTVMRRRGSAVSITELVSADGLIRGGKRSLELCAYLPEERPFGVQLFGSDPEVMLPAIDRCQEMGADFIDLNFGCPVPKVVKKGAGAAGTRDTVKLHAFLSSLIAGMDIPLTIKIRTGWDADSVNCVEVARVAEDVGCAWVAIHGRTRAQGYAGRADWDLIAEVARSVSIPVIGNGDLLDGPQCLERMEASGCAAVMVGRGVLRNPWMFLAALRQLHPEREVEPSDFVKLLEEQRALLEEHTTPRHTLLQLKKFSMWYSFGFPGSRAFRRGIFRHEDADGIFDSAREFFSSVAHLTPDDKDRKPFLKGGHG